MSLYFNETTAVIANGETISAEVYLGAECDFMKIVLPTLTSCKISLQGAMSAGGTFQALGLSQTTLTTTGAYSTMFRVGGYRYIKVVSSASQGAGREFAVQGMKV